MNDETWQFLFSFIHLDLLSLPQFMSLSPKASTTSEFAGFPIIFHVPYAKFSLLYCHQINLYENTNFKVTVMKKSPKSLAWYLRSSIIWPQSVISTLSAATSQHKSSAAVRFIYSSSLNTSNLFYKKEKILGKLQI